MSVSEKCVALASTSPPSRCPRCKRKTWNTSSAPMLVSRSCQRLCKEKLQRHHNSAVNKHKPCYRAKALTFDREKTMRANQLLQSFIFSAKTSADNWLIFGQKARIRINTPNSSPISPNLNSNSLDAAFYKICSEHYAGYN